ncbi:endopeptidase La [Candidatus Mesenet endosymbiont of Phosphuga atrata]|uniref:endopeptidase La n=1 Tax=Candidatus Mesenet endosymbiont of Phosphuga atrata TaxID=3066221 RepID=UPI0030D49729
MATETSHTIMLPVLALRDTVVFPEETIALFVGREKSVNALNYAMQNDSEILLITQIDEGVEDLKPQSLYKVGVIADILQLLKLPDSSIRIVVKGKKRAKIINYIDSSPFLKAEVSFISDEVVIKSNKVRDSVEALRESILSEFRNWNKFSKRIQFEGMDPINQIKDAGHLADKIASHLSARTEDKQRILECFKIEVRLELVYFLIKKEIAILDAKNELDKKIKSQIEEAQRKYYLSEMIKATSEKLENSEENNEHTVDKYEKKVKTTKLSAEAKAKAISDLKRYKKMNNTLPEATVIANYLDWLLDLPWGKYTKTKIDLESAAKILDQSHYGMEKVKKRIIEFLAVLERVKELKGQILCLVGPPGIGKTSLPESIAQAIGRKFVRMSLNGVKDTSEIRGHRRTYIASMPGRIIQCIKKAGSANPLFLLDEIDKIGKDFSGDPASALLEVLDPEHNKHFVDHYMEVEFDLSNVMFIATANTLNLPPPLIDRMEIIELSGYTEDEKVEITKNHLIPKLTKEHGLYEKEWEISDDALRKTIRLYTRESGIRNLKEKLSALMRKAIVEISTKKTQQVAVNVANLKDYLGVHKFRYGDVEEENLIGVTTGLAYTESGGDILAIESVLMPGKGEIKYTGKLGEVMQESIKAAYSYIRSCCLKFGIKSKQFQTNDIHLHVPEGATPKDGPSAGIAICTSIVSLMTKIPVNRVVAMTGEVTLRGRVLAIGGLKEKLLAALRVGINTVILPKQNEKDIEELPSNIKEGLKLIFVKNVDEVIFAALTATPTPIIADEFIEQEKNLPLQKESNNFSSTKSLKH